MSEPASLIEYRIKKICSELEQTQIAPEFVHLPEWARLELAETIMKRVVAMAKAKYGDLTVQI